jgi:hypothetical protein
LHARYRQAVAFNRKVALKTLVNGRSTKLVNIQSMKMVKKILPGSVSLRDRWARHISRHSGVRESANHDAQLRIGKSRDSGFDAAHRPGMTPR